MGSAGASSTTGAGLLSLLIVLIIIKRTNATIRKLRIAEIDEEILEIVKGVKDASATVMKYINVNVERLEDEKRQTEAEIQRLSEKCFAIKEKVICDFERFNELSFEQKRAVANAIIKKIYVSKDKLEIIWNI